MTTAVNLSTTKFSQRRGRAQGGQGLVEYVLLLVVVVGVILGVLYQMNQAVKVWADNYFGDYLACLLETGELPAVGGGSGSGECNREYREFNLADGRPMVGGGVQPGGGDGSDGGGNDDDGSGGAGPSAAAGGNLGRSALIPAGKSSSSRRYRAGRFAARGGRGAGGGANSDGGESGDTQGVSTDVASVNGYQQGRAVRIPIREAPDLKGGRRVKEKKNDRPTKTAIAKSKEPDDVEKRETLVKIERRVADTGEAPEIEEFTMGNWLRYFLIAILIIALVVVVGGELLQASKNME